MCSHVCWKLRGQWQIGNGRSLKDFLSTFSLPTSLACDDPVPSSWALLINGLCKFFFLLSCSRHLPHSRTKQRLPFRPQLANFFLATTIFWLTDFHLSAKLFFPFFFLDGNILVRRVGEVPVGGRRGGRPIFESGFKKKEKGYVTAKHTQTHWCKNMTEGERAN